MRMLNTGQKANVRNKKHKGTNKNKKYAKMKVPVNLVVLVNKKNRKVGVAEKIEAHKRGLLHRAFSIFVFNKKGELLIQKRALTKYHSGGIWANSVCSHPKPGEFLLQAAHRRLKEEMGFDCRLKKEFCFIYKASFKNGLTENEYDCVIAGRTDTTPKPNPEEVADYAWISVGKLKKDIKKNPEKYSVWLKIALKKWPKKQLDLYTSN
ncbi:MAG: isopentenyl-diphosphate Delta-isomerase [Candidatus Woesearchaeota archaeon]